MDQRWFRIRSCAWRCRDDLTEGAAFGTSLDAASGAKVGFVEWATLGARDGISETALLGATLRDSLVGTLGVSLGATLGSMKVIKKEVQLDLSVSAKAGLEEKSVLDEKPGAFHEPSSNSKEIPTEQM